jgi:hypothetical protein
MILLLPSPKTSDWKIRARVGPKKKWYTDVEELYAEIS